MRFRFADTRNKRETRARSAVLRRIDAWWSAFAKAARRIDASFADRSKFDIPKFMRGLERVHPQLMWEFGRALGKGRHRLVITAESDLALRPLVEAVLARAPRATGFEFYGYRPPAPLEEVAAMVRGRTGISLDGWSARVEATDDYGVDLTFVVPEAVAKLQAAPFAALFAAECLLGGETFDSQIDGVEVSAEARGKKVPLQTLARVVENTLERSRSKLPSKPLVKSTSKRNGAVFEVEPQEQPDYPRQKDVIVGATTNLTVARRALSERPFASQRFSRAGETFCYLKIDGTKGLDPRGFEDRGDIEDALDAALIKARLGATYGGATGLKYSYVELSLRDVERAVPIIRKVLRAGHIPKRTWLLFHDSTLQAEWVGLWDDTPAPP